MQNHSANVYLYNALTDSQIHAIKCFHSLPRQHNLLHVAA